MTRAVLTSIGLRLGGEARDNAYLARRHPEVLAAAADKGLARAFSLRGRDNASNDFDDAMARHLADPFLGAAVRHVLAPGETSITLELAAARDALAAARLGPGDIDLILCASWLPEHFVAPGNGVYLARELGTDAPAWNVESACAGALACLHLAHGMVASGQHRRVLVVVSSTVSRQVAADDTLGWIASDAAAAAVIEAADADEGPPAPGILGAHFVHTAATCGVFIHDLVAGPDGRAHVRMRAGGTSGHALRASAGPPLVRGLVDGALARAGLAPDDVDLFAPNTPLAWYGELCRRASALPRASALDLFPTHANLGAPYPLFNLYHALARGLLRPGQVALALAVGSVSSAGALALRVGEVALGPAPPRA